MIGLYGKLPARGDFVRLGLPADFVTRWDAWLQRVLSHAQAELPRAFQAGAGPRGWRFAVGPGLCGRAAMCGVLMPSVDRVGRRFPLTLAADLPGGLPWSPACLAAWFAACEEAGRRAVEDAAEPAAVMQWLSAIGAPLAGAPPAGAPPAGAPAGGTRWSAAGLGDPGAWCLILADLPEPALFKRMLLHAAEAASPGEPGKPGERNGSAAPA